MARFRAAGWNATQIEGLNHEAVSEAIDAALKSDRPSLIACKTVIGYGAPKKAGTSKAHGEPLGAEELAGREEGARLGLRAVRSCRTTSLRRGATPARAAQPARAAWRQRIAAKDAKQRGEFERRLARKRPAALAEAFAALKEKLAADKPTLATRKASELVLEVDHRRRCRS